MKCIVLDAMGVIFRAADDVADLLIPFVREAGGSTNAKEIESAYLDASLGIIEADDFWNRVGLAPLVEDNYLSRHSLVPGVARFLRNAKHQRIPVWCLSNDIDRWSRKLRVAFDIEGLLAGAIISSAVNVRKPDRRIYQFLLEQSGYRAEDLLFVDDRARNVEAAATIGIRSLRFSLDVGYGRLTEQLLGVPSKHALPRMREG
jgi:FMN phosphatase YigB (HAD superfamily)